MKKISSIEEDSPMEIPKGYPISKHYVSSIQLPSGLPPIHLAVRAFLFLTFQQFQNITQIVFLLY
jgi:hypothetical protein